MAELIVFYRDIRQKKQYHDIWRWKPRSWIGSGTQM